MIDSRRPSFLSLCLIVALSLALGACACSDCEDSSNASQPLWPYVRMAPMAPPEPVDEPVDVPDVPALYLWHPGYWMYNGRTFDWVSGFMMQRPSPTAVWSPDHWIEHTYGWVFIPGYWQ